MWFVLFSIWFFFSWKLKENKYSKFGTNLDTLSSVKYDMKSTKISKLTIKTALISVVRIIVNIKQKRGVTTSFFPMQPLTFFLRSYIVYSERTDLSIASTETKYINQNTKTQIIFLITFDFCRHFKEKTFLFSFCFLVKVYKKVVKFSFKQQKIFWVLVFGFMYLVLVDAMD